MKVLFLSLLTAISLLFSGCTPKTSTPTASGYTVIDDTGHAVTLSAKPQRIVSLSYGTDEILLALVAHERIRALCHYAGDEGITFVTKEERDKIGRTVDANPESIRIESPDLVLASTGTNQRVLESLSRMGIPVYRSLYPTNWAGLKKKIRGIAAVCGETSKGENIVREMDGKRDAVRQILSVIPEGKERSALALSFSGVVGKKGTLLAELMDDARIKNEAARFSVGGEGSVFTKESILEADPEVFLLPTWNFNGKSDAEALKKKILSDPAYASVRAVKNDRLVYVPDRYRYVTSQHAADSIEILAKAVYPELFQNQ